MILGMFCFYVELKVSGIFQSDMFTSFISRIVREIRYWANSSFNWLPPLHSIHSIYSVIGRNYNDTNFFRWWKKLNKLFSSLMKKHNDSCFIRLTASVVGKSQNKTNLFLQWNNYTNFLRWWKKIEVNLTSSVVGRSSMIFQKKVN